MNDSSKQDVNALQNSPAGPSKSTEKKKDIIVSIVLTESTTSLLNLDLPHLEDLNSETAHSSICFIKAESNIKETNYSEKCDWEEKKEFTKFWFSDAKKSGKKDIDCEEVSSEVAYFLSDTNMQESTSSLQVLEEQSDGKSETSNDHGISSSNINQKLKPTKVFTRPLYTVRSEAHQDRIKTQSNHILISLVNSQSSTADSEWVNVCRICHGGKSIGDLCAPCRCRGSIALVHLECLERWLKESANSHCELCQHHFQIIREPRYSVLKSIFMFVRHPGDHLWELIYDLCGFAIYTPAAIGSTYMLMLMCESAAKQGMQDERNVAAHIVAFSAVFGLAAIDFTYSAWFMTNMQKHVAAWRSWYQNNCELRLILSENKNYHRSSSSLVTSVD